MTVKNEADTIEACLAPIVDLLAQVVIIDTGSTDGTQEILRQRFGIVAQQAEMSFDNCHALATHRNRGFEQLQTPWTLSLDADERIDRDAFRDLLEMNDDALPHGLFCAWITHCGNGRWIEDYKLSLFRRGFTKQGLVHDTVQPSFRQQSGHAIWTDRIAIQHYPAPDRVEDKLDYYTRRLECACQQEPDWLRYQWFVGYTLFTRQRYDEARTALVELHKLRPVLFPVESLNASMVLAAIHARHGEQQAVRETLENALDYHSQVADDFEVKVNFRLHSWLQQALLYAETAMLDEIQPYPFPYGIY